MPVAILGARNRRRSENLMLDVIRTRGKNKARKQSGSDGENTGNF